MKTRLLIFMGLFFLAGCIQIPLLENLGAGTSKTGPDDAAFFDDFSDDDTGWDQVENPAGWSGYKAKTYQIHVAQPNADLFANPNQVFKDAIVEVTAWRVAGPEDNSFGVICRYKDVDNFYSGQITSDGYAGIFRMLEGEYELLQIEKMIPAPAVLGGTAANQIRLECVGNTLTLIVNGSPLDFREDDNFETGDVGLIAGTFGQPGVTIAFDDFLVKIP